MKKGERALPGEVCRGLVVAFGRRVVVEGVIDAIVVEVHFFSRPGTPPPKGMMCG